MDFDLDALPELDADGKPVGQEVDLDALPELDADGKPVEQKKSLGIFGTLGAQTDAKAGREVGTAEAIAENLPVVGQVMDAEYNRQWNNLRRLYEGDFNDAIEATKLARSLGFSDEDMRRINEEAGYGAKNLMGNYSRFDMEKGKALYKELVAPEFAKRLVARQAAEGKLAENDLNWVQKGVVGGAGATKLIGSMANIPFAAATLGVDATNRAAQQLEGKWVLDENGQPTKIWWQTDENGDPVRDEAGNLVPREEVSQDMAMLKGFAGAATERFIWMGLGKVAKAAGGALVGAAEKTAAGAAVSEAIAKMASGSIKAASEAAEWLGKSSLGRGVLNVGKALGWLNEKGKFGSIPDMMVKSRIQEFADDVVGLNVADPAERESFKDWLRKFVSVKENAELFTEMLAMHLAMKTGGLSLNLSGRALEKIGLKEESEFNRKGRLGRAAEETVAELIGEERAAKLTDKDLINLYRLVTSKGFTAERAEQFAEKIAGDVDEAQKLIDEGASLSSLAEGLKTRRQYSDQFVEGAKAAAAELRDRVTLDGAQSAKVNDAALKAAEGNVEIAAKVAALAKSRLTNKHTQVDDAEGLETLIAEAMRPFAPEARAVKIHDMKGNRNVGAQLTALEELGIASVEDAELNGVVRRDENGHLTGGARQAVNLLVNGTEALKSAVKDGSIDAETAEALITAAHTELGAEAPEARAAFIDGILERAKGDAALARRMAENEMSEFGTFLSSWKSGNEAEIKEELDASADLAKTELKLEAEKGATSEISSIKLSSIEGGVLGCSRFRSMTAEFGELGTGNGERGTGKVLRVKGLGEGQLAKPGNWADGAVLVAELQRIAEKNGAVLDFGSVEANTEAAGLLTKVEREGLEKAKARLETRAKLVDILARSALDTGVTFDEASFRKALEETSNGRQYIDNHGNIYGIKSADGTLHFNPLQLDYNIPIHEYGHLALESIKGINRRLWERGMELVRGSDYYRSIKEQAETEGHEYSYLKGDEAGICDEALAHLIGDNGEKLIEGKGVGAELKAWLKDFWKAFKGAFGLADMTDAQIEKMTLGEFVDAVNAELLRGKEFGTRKDVSSRETSVKRYDEAQGSGSNGLLRWAQGGGLFKLPVDTTRTKRGGRVYLAHDDANITDYIERLLNGRTLMMSESGNIYVKGEKGLPKSLALIFGYRPTIGMNDGLFERLASELGRPEYATMTPEDLVAALEADRANYDSWKANEAARRPGEKAKTLEERAQEEYDRNQAEAAEAEERRHWESSGMNVPEYILSRIEDGEPGFDLDWETMRELAHDEAEGKFAVGGIFTGTAADYANRSRQGGVDDGPSLTKIGTGEGSQVYGWGLYGSTVRGVAESYTTKFGHKVLLDGKPYETGTRIQLMLSAIGSVDGAITRLRDEPGGEKYAKWIEDNRDRITIKPQGNIYEQTFFTDRAPGDESHLLKWYEPVNGWQKELLENALSENGVTIKHVTTGPDYDRGTYYEKDGKLLVMMRDQNAKLTGELAYQLLAKDEVLGSPKAASEWLAAHGIDGVKYPVDSYGGKGVKDGDEAGWNYVSFRDDNIRVDHKWTDGQAKFAVAGKKGAENMGIKGAADAEQMEKDGASREDIWRTTGWWRGKDGQWRVELPSVRMKGEKELEAVLLKGVNVLRDGSSETTLEKVMDAPELFKAYPQLKDTKIVFSPERDGKTGGWYNKDKNEIVILNSGLKTLKQLNKRDRDFYDTYQRVIASDEFNQLRLRNMDALGIKHGTAAEERENAKKWIAELDKRIQDENAATIHNLAKERGKHSTFGTIVHEVQHAVQDLEGFAKGGDPESAAALVRNLKRKQRIWLYKLSVEETAKELGTTNPYEIEKAILGMLGATSREQVAGLEAEGWIPDKAGRDKGYNLFARGYDKEGYEEAYDKYLGEMKKSGMASWWDGSPYELYRRLAGEVEARNASRREEMTPEERAATPPWKTEDVPEDRQIVMFSRAKAVSDANGNESYKVESNGKTKRYKTPKEALEDFIKELDGQTLNEEQQGIYDVVTGVKNTADIRKNDLGELVKFHKGGRGKGAGKIIAVHYAGKRGKVTAKEVIDIGQVIRSGTLDYDGTAEHPYSHTYTATASDGAELKVVIDLDKKGNEAVINFYSDRKTGNGGQRPHPVSTTTSSSPQSIPNSGAGAQGGVKWSRGGKPPEAELVQTATRQFKRWFGDPKKDPAGASKIVDENGEPLEVWHGGPDNTFTAFDPARIQEKDGVRGFYFAPPNRRDSIAGYYGHGGERAFYLNIRNPLVIGPDTKPTPDELKSHDGIVRVAQKDHPERKFYNYRSDSLGSEQIRKGDIIEIVVFEPNQVKSATENIGTFDPGNNDIRFAVGGQQIGEFVIGPNGIARRGTPQAAMIGGARVADDAGRGEQTPGSMAAALERLNQTPTRIADYGKVRPMSLPLSELEWLRKKLTGDHLPATVAKRIAGGRVAAHTKAGRLTIAADVFGLVDKTDMAREKDLLRQHGFFRNEDPGWSSTHSPSDIRDERSRSEEQLATQLLELGKRRAEGREAGGESAARGVYANELAKIVMELPRTNGGVIGRVQKIGDGVRANVKAILGERGTGNRERMSEEAKRFLDWARGGTEEQGAEKSERELTDEMFGAWLVMPEEMRKLAPTWHEAILRTVAETPKLAEAFKELTTRGMTKDAHAHVFEAIRKSQSAAVEKVIAELNADAAEHISAGSRTRDAEERFIVAFHDSMGPLVMRIDWKAKEYIKARRKVIAELKAKGAPKADIAAVQAEIDRFAGNIGQLKNRLELSRTAYERGTWNEGRRYMLQMLLLENRAAKQWGLTEEDKSQYLNMQRIVETQGRAAAYGMDARQASLVLGDMARRLGTEKWNRLQQYGREFFAIMEREFLNDPRVERMWGKGLVDYFRSQAHYVTTKRIWSPEELDAIETARAQARKSGVNGGDDVIGAMFQFASAGGTLAHGLNEGAFTGRLKGSMAAKQEVRSATWEKQQRLMQSARLNQFIIDARDALLAAGVTGVRDVKRGEKDVKPGSRYGTINYVENGVKRTLIVPREIADGFKSNPNTLPWISGFHNICRSLMIDWNPAYWNRNIMRNSGSIEKNMPGMHETWLKTVLRIAPGLAPTVDLACQHLARHSRASAKMLSALFGGDTIFPYIQRAERMAKLLEDPTRWQERLWDAEARGDAGAVAEMQEDLRATMEMLKGNMLVPTRAAYGGRNTQGFANDMMNKAGFRMLEQARRDASRSKLWNLLGKANVFKRNERQQEFEDVLAKSIAYLHDRAKYSMQRSAEESGLVVKKNVSIAEGERKGRAAGTIQQVMAQFFNMTEKGVVRTWKAVKERPGETLGKMARTWTGRFIGAAFATGLVSRLIRSLFDDDEKKIAESKFAEVYNFSTYMETANRNLSNYVRDHYQTVPLWVSPDSYTTIVLGTPLNDEDSLLAPSADYAAQLLGNMLGAHNKLETGKMLADSTFRAVTPDLAIAAPAMKILRDTVWALFVDNPTDLFTGAPVYDRDLYEIRNESWNTRVDFAVAMARQVWNDVGARGLYAFDRQGVDTGTGAAPKWIGIALNDIPVLSPLLKSFVKVQVGSPEKDAKPVREEERRRQAIRNYLSRKMMQDSAAMGGAMNALDPGKYAKTLEEWQKTYGLSDYDMRLVEKRWLNGWRELENEDARRGKAITRALRKARKLGIEDAERFMIRGEL